MPDPGQLTERQQQWLASVLASLQKSTGRSLAEWAEIARACPETAHRKRLAWMKQVHGLGQNYASAVLNAAFPPETSWREPQGLEAALWRDAQARVIFAAVRTQAELLPEVIVGQRKGFTAFSRKFQFASMRPVGQQVRLGLALPPGADPRLVAARNEGWSERLLAMLVLTGAEAVDDGVARLLRASWERS